VRSLVTRGALLLAVTLTSSAALARRQPPPAVIPTEDTQKARDLYKVGRYGDAVAAAKAALNKNERYTPAMLVMAKSYYKLHKYEWMKKLWEMMQANGASSAEKAEIYQLLAFLEVDQKNVPGGDPAVQAGRRVEARRRDPVEQPGRPVPGGQELHRRHAGARAGRQASTGFREGASESG